MGYHRQQRQMASAQRAYDNMTPPEDPICRADSNYDCDHVDLLEEDNCGACPTYKEINGEENQ